MPDSYLLADQYSFAMSNNPISFGFLGAGAISHWAAQSVQSHPLGRIVAAQDIHAGRLGELCAVFQIPKACTTAEELLSLTGLGQPSTQPDK
ncbi:MAG: hypothetical protein WCS65_08015 [Verrucomicrobiae bacterium]